MGIDLIVFVDSNFLFGTSNFLSLITFGLCLLSNLDFAWLIFYKNALFSLFSSAFIFGEGVVIGKLFVGSFGTSGASKISFFLNLNFCRNFCTGVGGWLDGRWGL